MENRPEDNQPEPLTMRELWKWVCAPSKPLKRTEGEG